MPKSAARKVVELTTRVGPQKFSPNHKCKPVFFQLFCNFHVFLVICSYLEVIPMLFPR